MDIFTVLIFVLMTGILVAIVLAAVQPSGRRSRRWHGNVLHMPGAQGAGFESFLMGSHASAGHGGGHHDGHHHHHHHGTHDAGWSTVHDAGGHHHFGGHDGGSMSHGGGDGGGHGHH